MIQELEKDVTELQEIQAKVVKKLLKFVKDKKNSLEDRWNIFCKFGEQGYLPSGGYIEHFTGKVGNWANDDYLDGESISKYEVVTASRMVESAEYEMEDGDLTQKDIDSLKEQWMTKFIWSFEFDW